MIKVEKNRCSGCSACANICTHGAITMTPDGLGFKYPVIDPDKCIDCGLCDKVCQFKDDYDRYDNYESPYAFALRLKDKTSLQKSQSGGAFYAIAEQIINQGGVVYGVGMSDDFVVLHKRASTIEDLQGLRYSKYVQSDLRDTLVKIKQDLKEGLSVLFSGTPCQVSGLRSFIPSSLNKRLYTIDLICHGVPSPAVWKSNVKNIAAESNKAVDHLVFRNKSMGWKGAIETYWFNDGSHANSYSFSYLFYKLIMNRESCANCKFTNLKRVADLTIGDLWGYDVSRLGWNDNKGVSICLVNSDKGESLLKLAQMTAYVKPVPVGECLQPNLQRPTGRHSDSERFASEYIAKGYNYVLKRYGDKGWRYKKETMILNVKIFILKLLRRR